MHDEEQAVPGQEIEPAKNRRPKKVRPNGELYSSDPKERYQQLVEDGKIGPQFGRLGGRPRKPRAAEKVAEYARREADKIIGAYEEALDGDNTRLKMEAANALIKIERDEASLQLEEDEFDKLSAEDQAAAIVALMSDPMLAAALNPAVPADPEDEVEAADWPDEGWPEDDPEDG